MMSVSGCEVVHSPRSSGGDFQCTEDELFESFMEIVNNPDLQALGDVLETTNIDMEEKDLNDNENNNIGSGGFEETQLEPVDTECHETEVEPKGNDDESGSQEEQVISDNDIAVTQNTCKDVTIDHKDPLGQDRVEDGESEKCDFDQSQSNVSQIRDSVSSKDVNFNETEDLSQEHSLDETETNDVNHETDNLTEQSEDINKIEESTSQEDNHDVIEVTAGLNQEEVDSDQIEDQKPEEKSESDNGSPSQPTKQLTDEIKLQELEQDIEEGIKKAAQVCDELHEFVKRMSCSSDEILDDGPESQLEASTEDKIPSLPRDGEATDEATVEVGTGNAAGDATSETTGEATVPKTEPECPETDAFQQQSPNIPDTVTHSDEDKDGPAQQIPNLVVSCHGDDSSSTSSSHTEDSHHDEGRERNKSTSESIDSSEGSLSGDYKSNGVSPSTNKVPINWDILNTAFENPDTDEEDGDAYESSGNFGGFGLMLDDSSAADDDRPRSVSQSSTISEYEFQEEYKRQHSTKSINKRIGDGVLCAGFLLKLGGTGITPKNWRKRWCVLRQDRCLYYYKTSKDKIPCGIVVLTNYIVSRSSEFHKRNCLKISKGGGRTYFFSSETPQDMLRWMEALRTAADIPDEGANFVIRNEIIHNVAIPALSIKNPDCHGYLTKQGAKNWNSWKRRYCVLKNGCLYYYREMADTTALGVAKLHGYKLEEVTFGKRNCFRAVPPNSGMRTFTFVADNEFDKKRWIPCLEQSIQSHNTSS